jgi:hypothetical protein
MSRRALPVAVAAAALVLVPSTASATPDDAPETRVGESSYAYAFVSLSDGRRVLASLSELHNGPGNARQAAVSLAVSSGRYCWPTSLCDAGTGQAFLELDPKELDFDRNLAGASVTDLPVTLQRTTVTSTGTFTQVEEVVRVSLTFLGTGDVVRDTSHPEFCGDGSGECQSTQINFSREATADITIDDVSGSAAGQLHRGRFVEAGITYAEEGTG